MYRLTQSPDVILFVDGGVYIPADTGNVDYQAYLVWISEGGEAEPYVAPAAPAPTVITMRQARLALLQAQLLGGVSAAIAALPPTDRAVAEVEWEFAAEVRRDHPLLVRLAPALGLDEEALDALFVLAAQL